MFKVEQPNIIFSEVVDYAKETDVIYYKDIAIFHSMDKLIEALACHHRPVLNLDFKPITGQFYNKYLEAQTLMGTHPVGSLLYDDGYFRLNRNFWIGKYMFCWDTPGRPYFDVRNLKSEIEKKYFEGIKKTNSFSAYRQDKLNPKRRIKKKFYRHKYHKSYEWRDDARYIQRGRAASGMMAEPEYKEFAKPKDRWMKSIWKDEDFCSKGGSSGWKDNSGYRYRHQWEVKAARDYERAKRKKECIFG